MLKLALMLLALAPCPAWSAPWDKEAYVRFMNGMIQERKGNYDAALQEYKRTLALSPGELFVYKQALNLALHVGKLQEAETWAEYAVAQDSGSADTWVLYGNVKWARGDSGAARTAYEKAVELDPASHEALYQLASLSSAGEPDKAVAYLKRYLEVKPDDAADIHYQIAVVYNLKGDAAAVEKHLQLSREADSFYVQPRYMLAELYENRADTAAALGVYKELLALETRNVQLMVHIGELYASPAVGDLAEAERYFLMARAVDKSDKAACFWLSAISEDRRDYAAAAGYMEDSSELKEDPGAVLRLGYYYTQSGRYPKAVELLESAYRKWPENNELAYFLALGYDDTGRTGKGLELLRAVIARAPAHKEARLQYAIISERENDIAEAEKHFRVLLSSDPHNANLLNYLGYSLADRGLKLEEARGMIEKAAELEPRNGAYRDSLAWVLFRLGRAAEARPELEKALALLPEDPVIWLHYGEILEASGAPGEAWQAYRTSVLLEKPAKRDKPLSRLEKLQPALPAAAELRAAYLKRFIPQGLPFSTFAKIQARLKGKTVKLDALLRYSPEGELSLTVMGPLMTPLWKGRVSAAGAELDPMSLNGADPAAFAYWAGLMLRELRALLAGVWTGQVPAAWKEDCAAGAEREICYGGDLWLPREIKPAGERRLEARPDGYFLKNLYLFPGAVTFKMPFVSVTLALDAEQMNFGETNALYRPAPGEGADADR